MNKQRILYLALSIFALSLPILFRTFFGRLILLNWSFLDWLAVLPFLISLALAAFAFPRSCHLILKLGYSSYPIFLLALVLSAASQALTNNWSVTTLDSSKSGLKVVIYEQQSDDFEYLVCYKVLIPEVLGFQLVRVNLKDVANHFDHPEYCKILSDKEILLSLHERKYRINLDSTDEVDANRLVESTLLLQ